MAPKADVIARRTALLAALVRRGEVEFNLSRTSGEGVASDASAAQARAAAISDWVQAEVNVADDLPTEFELLLLPAGEWREVDVVEAGWKTEAIGALLWAIGALDDMGSYDRQLSQDALLDASGVLESPWELPSRAVLRDRSELARGRDVAEIWHVRSLVEEAMRRDEPPAGGQTFEAIIEELVAEAALLGAIDEAAEGDLPFLARPYPEITGDALLLAQSIAYERYMALFWVCGDAG